MRMIHKNIGIVKGIKGGEVGGKVRGEEGEVGGM